MYDISQFPSNLLMVRNLHSFLSLLCLQVVTIIDAVRCELAFCFKKNLFLFGSPIIFTWWYQVTVIDVGVVFTILDVLLSKLRFAFQLNFTPCSI